MDVLSRAAALAALLLVAAAPTPQPLPDGHAITPTAAPGASFQDLDPGFADHPDFRAGQAMRAVLSPDGKTLAVLTSGFNDVSAPNGQLDAAESTEHVFLYDVQGPNAPHPALRQIIPIPNSFAGLVFAADGGFYVSGGADDCVYRFSPTAAGYTQTAAIALGHHASVLPVLDKILRGGLGFKQGPLTGALALSADGATLVAANVFNASISLIDTKSNQVLNELDLRPYAATPKGAGHPGGETPIALAIAGSTVYVASARDREIDAVSIADRAHPKLTARFTLPGTPTALLVDRTRLFVAQDNSDHVTILDTDTGDTRAVIDLASLPGATATPARLTGTAPNALALAPDGNTLYVTLGNENALAVVNLAGATPTLSGLIPTGWYPQSAAIAGNAFYVVNAKSNPGPNPQHLSGSTARLHSQGNTKTLAIAARASNEYILQLEHAGLLAAPIPSAATLATLTNQVIANNNLARPLPQEAETLMAALHTRIHHIIYIVKENRTFDQVLGDLGNGSNGDKSLAMFGARITPNFHAIAKSFVTFDNFTDASEVSGNGWQWATAARETDLNQKFIPLDYAKAPNPSATNGGHRAGAYDAEGQNQGVDVGIPTLAGRITAEPLYKAAAAMLPGGAENLLPGSNDDAAPDGPDGARQQGYLWNAALRAGLSVRNYGFYVDLDAKYKDTQTPFADHAIQAYVTNPALLTRTDPYFRSFDNTYADYWRYTEWKREFDQFVATKSLPTLTFLRYMHDHMGEFASALGGINFPEAQQADNDLAVGLTLQAIANSPYASDTLVFVVEDDAQDGPDHVNAHRSTAYIAGPYVKHHAIDSAPYNQIDMIRTIEDILGTGPLNINDAHATPMWTAFDLDQKQWSYTATASPFLKGTADEASGVRFADAAPTHPARTAAWWAAHTKNFDFSVPDRAPAAAMNALLAQAFLPAKP